MKLSILVYMFLFYLVLESHYGLTFQVYSVCDAIAMHRETHHPSQIGLPDGLVNAYIELSLSADKKVSQIGKRN